MGVACTGIHANMQAELGAHTSTSGSLQRLWQGPRCAAGLPALQACHPNDHACPLTGLREVPAHSLQRLLQRPCCSLILAHHILQRSGSRD